MNVATFTMLSLLGTTIWNFALILLGRLLSDSFDVLMSGIHTYSYFYVCDSYHYYSICTLSSILQKITLNKTLLYFQIKFKQLKHHC